ncbi:guanylate kinase [Bradyrhizobium sp. JR7.2]
MAVHDEDGIERRGLMFVLSAPSGAGATTLSRLLIARTPGLRMSVSVTTRAMRSGEVDGRDYLFVDGARFEDLVKRNELLEWATVFGNRYGTPRAPVEAALSAGEDVLFDIDWQGTQQLREKARADVVSVFILPPSLADLEKRMLSRAQDSHDVIRRRMGRASHEMSHWAEYDYVVMNQDIDAAFAEVQSILKAERLKRERRFGLSNRIRAAIEIWSTSSGDRDLTAADDNNQHSPVTEPRSEAPSEDSSSPNSGRGRPPTVGLAARGTSMATGRATASVQANAPQSWESAFELLQARVALLEAALASRPVGMGHNKGPDLDVGLNIDEEEIQTFISVLKDQRPTGPVDVPKLIEAAKIADPTTNKWRERVDEFAKGTLKGAGMEIGKHVIQHLAQARWFSSVYSALEAIYEVLKKYL